VTTRILALRPGESLPNAATIDDLPALLADPASIVWVDMLDAGEGDKKLLEEVFRFHPTVVEDMLADAPTPKLERFDGYLYIVFHALLPGWEKALAEEIKIGDLDVMLGKNFLLTSHGTHLPSVESAWQQVQKKPDCMRKGPAYAAYMIADVLSERFLPLMERLDHEIDALETSIIKNPGPHLLETIFGLKHKLQRLRRVGLHQREVLNRLSRGDREVEIIPEEVKPFFRDAYDNFVRVVDLNDSFREIVSSAMEGYLSMQGHKLNEIMKVLTLISTIMLPLTFIAGVYGMNFDVMPELHWSYGYFSALGAMGVTAIVFFIYFRRKGWI
jgi:magnesium transporter